MKPPRRRTLAALGAGVVALHVAGGWQWMQPRDVTAGAALGVVWLDVRPVPPDAPAAAPTAEAVAAVVPPALPTRAPQAQRPPSIATTPRDAVPAADTSAARVAAPESAAVARVTATPPPTTLPPPVRLRYRLERGDQPAGEAELDWQPDGDRYAARLLLRPEGGRTIEQTSAGALGPAGLAPLRFVDRRTGRAMAVNFQAERGVVGFSGLALERPLPDGAQDRLSWMLQLAARVQADPATAAAGIELPVFGTRGDGGAWRFEPAGDAGDGLLHLRRAAAGPYDGAVEVWLDPARHHLPARLVLHPPAGDARPALVLALEAAPAAGLEIGLPVVR